MWITNNWGLILKIIVFIISILNSAFIIFINDLFAFDNFDSNLKSLLRYICFFVIFISSWIIFIYEKIGVKILLTTQIVIALIITILIIYYHYFVMYRQIYYSDYKIAYSGLILESILICIILYLRRKKRTCYNKV